ncbi:hypothetical protein QE152_g12514 [Popillia japonica]|uniref:Uncharacterized protein n=1 Tax=Popillia japonica TaxID=7064 RepID=A0AAW1LRM8_POPJA
MRVIASFLSPNKQTGKIPDLAEQSHNVGEANIEVDITVDTATQIAHKEMDICQTQVHVLPDAELTPEAVDDNISEPEAADDVFVPKPGPSHSKADVQTKTKLRRELLKVKRRVLRLQSAPEAIPTKQGFLKQCDIHLSSELAAIVKFIESINTPLCDAYRIRRILFRNRTLDRKLLDKANIYWRTSTTDHQLPEENQLCGGTGVRGNRTSGSSTLPII